jgi:hypothetical protein
MAEKPPVSDAHREEALDTLAGHTVAGELSEDERAARSRKALQADSPEQLEEATRGLADRPRPRLLSRAADLVPLRAHVAAFLAVSAVMLVVWALTRDTASSPGEESAGLFWPFWAMLAWGVVLTAHALYSLRRPAFQIRGRPPRKRHPS